MSIRELTELPDLHEAGMLFSALWKTRAGCPEISDDLLKALELAGNYIAGAYEVGSPDRLVGASVAFASVHSASAPTALHSHITGAAPGRLGAGIGFALKLHQRAWALDRGIATVNWTFDPLVRRNSVFNLAKLGARATTYLRDVYGSLTDVLNAGGESDRLLASWSLSDEAVAAAAAGRRRFVNAQSAPVRLGPDEAMKPLLSTASHEPVFRVSVPEDIEALRLEDPSLAHEWRAAVRDVLGKTLDEGGRLLGVDSKGDFVLEEAAS